MGQDLSLAKGHDEDDAKINKRCAAKIGSNNLQTGRNAIKTPDSKDDVSSPSSSATDHPRRSLLKSLRKIKLNNSFRKVDSSWSSETSRETSGSYEEDPEEAVLPPGIEEFILKKRKPGGCIGGMYWKEDPTGQTWLHHNLFWPRDFASIRGKVVKHKGEKWLLATQVRQLGSTRWRTAPKGAALPFFYSDRYMLVPKSQLHRALPPALQKTVLQQANEAMSSPRGAAAKATRKAKLLSSSPTAQTSALTVLGRGNSHESSFIGLHDDDDVFLEDDLCFIFPGSNFQGVFCIKQCRALAMDSSSNKNADNQKSNMVQFSIGPDYHMGMTEHEVSNDLLSYFRERTRIAEDSLEGRSGHNSSASLALKVKDWFPNATILGGDTNGFAEWSEEREPWQVFEVLELLLAATNDLLHSRRVLALETAGTNTLVAKAGPPRVKKLERPQVARTQSTFAIKKTTAIRFAASMALESQMEGALERKLRDRKKNQ